MYVFIYMCVCVCGFPFEYPLQITFKHIYLTHSWDTNRSYNSRSGWIWE